MKRIKRGDKLWACMVLIAIAYLVILINARSAKTYHADGLKVVIYSAHRACLYSPADTENKNELGCMSQADIEANYPAIK